MSKLLLSSLLILIISLSGKAQKNTSVEYVNEFKNSNHPQIAYWFLTPGILENGQYLKDLDNMMERNPFDLIYLDARNGASFSDVGKMHPILEKIVNKAHERNIKVGYRTQVEIKNPVPDEVAERFIAGVETKLDRNGNGSCELNAKFVRSRSSYKKELFKVWAFKKTSNGFYDPSTLREIPAGDFTIKDENILVSIKAGKQFSGYTAYVMGGFYYRSNNNYCQEAIDGTKKFIDQYKDIPFDGVMLDEYGNAKIIPPWKIQFKFGSFRLQSCSVPMAKELETKTGEPAAKTLFHLRYAPAGKPEIRMRAINIYMDLMREGSLRIENTMYKKAKETYGQSCFIAAHNTFHNSLVNDEIWATGLKWWSIPRENGFTDEKTPTPTQMGIAFSYPSKVMYNMYYDSKIKRFSEKTFTDLRYGIRTFYHAFNDKQWGLGLEMPESVEAINPVERCTRLMNRFNPSLPEIRLLVIFGNEALQNWYPDRSQRGRYDINDKLKIEEKAVSLWKAGYRNALVPTDLITDGKLKLDDHHRPVLSGHSFDAILFLYPQYAKESTLKFLEEYVGNGGKLMLEGNAPHDFDGSDISGRMQKIEDQATVKGFSIDRLSELGLTKNAVKGGCKNEDGSYVFTDIASLRKSRTVTFKVTFGQDVYTGEYTGFAAISADPQQGIQKLACAGFRELKKNGVTILKLERPADIFVEKQEAGYKITIADKEQNKLTVNKL
ncbi:MAG: hypothetical protein WCK18_17105 [Prolixibacteraceae bacterium]